VYVKNADTEMTYHTLICRMCFGSLGHNQVSDFYIHPHSTSASVYNSNTGSNSNI
jgi:hypothetical protein